MPGRIRVDISADVKRMRKFLQAIESDRGEYAAFVEAPERQLARHNIDLDRYGSRRLPTSRIVKDIVSITQQVVEKGLRDQLGKLVQHVMSSREYSTTEYEYNFDHSVRSEYRYEMAEKTERGTFAETHAGSVVSESQTFSGLSPAEISELFAGPLISEAAMQTVLLNVQKSLKHAENVARKSP